MMLDTILVVQENQGMSCLNGFRNSRSGFRVAWERVILLILVHSLISAHSYAESEKSGKSRLITSPTIGAPAFVQPGHTFAVSLDVFGAGVLQEVWLHSIMDESVVQLLEAATVLEAGGDLHEFMIPESASAGLYDLHVSVTVDGKARADSEPHAIAVVESFAVPFTFAQVTDYHVGDPRILKRIPGIDVVEVRRQAAEAVNRLKPAFVLITGDICAYAETYERDYPVALEEIRSLFTVPTLIVPGNHDLYAKTDGEGKLWAEGLDFWHKTFGPTHYSMDYGPFRFVGINTYSWPQGVRNHNRKYHKSVGTRHTYSGTLSREELDWLKEQLKTLDGQKPILFAHHGPEEFEEDPSEFGCDSCVSRDEFLAFLKDAGVPLYIYGHIHYTEDYTEDGTRFVAVSASGSYNLDDNPWAMRVFRAREDLTIETVVVPFLWEAPLSKIDVDSDHSAEGQ